MGKDITGSSRTRCGNSGARKQERKPSAQEIVRGARRGERNPFRQGSPEGIAYAFTEQLQRHAGGRGRFARIAQRALDSHDPQPVADMPPVPALKPLAPGEELPPLPGERPTEVPPESPQPLWAQSDIVPVSRDYADAIARAERSADYRALHVTKDGVPNAFGRYQIQRDGLIDIGLMARDGQWNPEMGVRTLEDFLGNPTLQDAALAAYLGSMRGFLRNVTIKDEGIFHQNAFDDVGQRVQGIRTNFIVTEGGLLAAAHRQGQGNVVKYLNHQ